MHDAEKLAAAYGEGFQQAEMDVIDYGEKRWLDPTDTHYGDEEWDSYWTGYEDYTEEIVEDSVPIRNLEIRQTANGYEITGDIPEGWITNIADAGHYSIRE